MKSMLSNLVIAGGLIAGTVVVAQSGVLDLWTNDDGSFYQDANYAAGDLKISAQERVVSSAGETVLDLQIAVERPVFSATETDYYVVETKQGEATPVSLDVFPATANYELTGEAAEGTISIDLGNRENVSGTLLDADFSADVAE